MVGHVRCFGYAAVDICQRVQGIEFVGVVGDVIEALADARRDGRIEATQPAESQARPMEGLTRVRDEDFFDCWSKMGSCCRLGLRLIYSATPSPGGADCFQTLSASGSSCIPVRVRELCLLVPPARPRLERSWGPPGAAVSDSESRARAPGPAVPRS